MELNYRESNMKHEKFQLMININLKQKKMSYQSWKKSREFCQKPGSD